MPCARFWAKHRGLCLLPGPLALGFIQILKVLVSEVTLIAGVQVVTSGNRQAAQYFAELGALVIDADQLARAAIERGSDGFDEVVALFGDSILKDGNIDRRALGDLIFKDPISKTKLENIIHPFVRREFEEAVASLKGDQVLVYEIPLLVETNAHEKFDLVITVESEMENRIARLRGRGMHISEIEGRVAAQATREQRIEVADFLIENDGSEDELLRQVENIWDSLHDNK